MILPLDFSSILNSYSITVFFLFVKNSRKVKNGFLNRLTQYEIISKKTMGYTGRPKKMYSDLVDSSDVNLALING